MIYHLPFRSSVRRTGLAMAMVAAGIVWTLRLPDNVGAQSGFNGSSRAIRPSGRRPVAEVITVSGPASAHWNGRSRPLAAGSGLEAGEIIVTGVHSKVLVKTADGGEFTIFPKSRAKFRENRRMWLDQVDRWLNGLKTHLQRLKGPPPSDPFSCPAAVMAVRAAILPSPVRSVAESGRRWIGMRKIA